MFESPAVMKPNISAPSRRKKKKKSKQQTCSFCHQLCNAEKLDKHMHSRSHHEALERLLGGQQMHKCWACDMSVLGLEEYESHIGTSEHITKLGCLQWRREHGFKVDYEDKELEAICVQRKKELRQLKYQKKKEKMKMRKVKKVAESQSAHGRWQEGSSTTDNLSVNQTTVSDNHFCNQQSQSIAPKLTDGHQDDNDQLQKQVERSTTNPNPTVEPVSDAGDQPSIESELNQAGSWSSFYKQQSRTSTPEVDEDFTSDHVTSFSCLMFNSCHLGEDTTQGSVQHTQTNKEMQKRARKRLSAVCSSNSQPMKRRSLRSVSSASLKLKVSDGPSFGKGIESDSVGEPTSSDEPSARPCAPRLVQSQVNPVSMMSRNIRRSRDKEEPNNETLQKRKIKTFPLTGSPGWSEKSPVKPLSGCQPVEVSTKTNQKKKVQLNKARRKKSPQIKPLSTLNHPVASGADMQSEVKNDASGEQEHEGSKHALPALLRRSVSKAAASKPNLNMARGTRSSEKPDKAVGESKVLRPALQKLISSKSSQWKVNWREMFEEATKIRLQRERGMPRFGIEMVSPLPPAPPERVMEEVRDFILDESFHWQSVNLDAKFASASVPMSGSELVEGSVPSEGPGTQQQTSETVRTNYVTQQVGAVPMMKSEHMENARGNNWTSEMQRTSKPRMEGEEHFRRKDTLAADTESTLPGGFLTQHHTAPDAGSVCMKNENLDDYGTVRPQRIEENRFDSSLIRRIKKENKKRKINEDIPNMTLQNAKPLKGQLDELLTWSLREEELNRSLEDVDGKLLHAHAAMQVAFTEVQRLQIVKEQVSTEMASLRAKRMEILQSIQNSSVSETSRADPSTPANKTRTGATNTSKQAQAVMLNCPAVETVEGSFIIHGHVRGSSSRISHNLQNKPSTSPQDAAHAKSKRNIQQGIRCPDQTAGPESLSIHLQTDLRPVLENIVTPLHGLSTESRVSKRC